MSQAELEMGARRLESRAALSRSHRLELCEQHVATPRAAGLADACPLEQRVRSVEVKLAAATRMLRSSKAQGGVAAVTWVRIRRRHNEPHAFTRQCTR